MLEILVLFFLCKKIGEMVRRKGRTAIGYQVMTVLFWIGGEVGGGIAWVIFMIVTGAQIGADIDLTIIPFALVGAAMGAGLSFLIVHWLPPAETRVMPYMAGAPYGQFPLPPYKPSSNPVAAPMTSSGPAMIGPAPTAWGAGGAQAPPGWQARKCPYCKANVVPSADGTCLLCRQRVA